MLWQLRCHCNPDHDKFLSTVVAIFPNVFFMATYSLCSNLALTLKNSIEPPLYASTAYVVTIWPSFLFNSSVKIWDTCDNFLGKWYTAPHPPGKKFPVRLCVQLRKHSPNSRCRPPSCLLAVFAVFLAIISPCYSCSSYSWNEWNVRHFFSQPKQLNLVPRSSRLTVH